MLLTRQPGGGEDVVNRDGKAGQQVAAIKHVIHLEGAILLPRRQHRYGRSRRIDQPDQAHAVQQVKVDLAKQTGAVLAGRQNLDGKIGRGFEVGACRQSGG